jgi:transposase
MIGIDVSQATLSVACWDPERQDVAWSCELPNTPEGLAQLLARTAPGDSWALEPTGRCSELTVRTAWAHGRWPLLTPTKAARRFLSSLNLRAKNDRLDAVGIARYAALVALRPYRLKDRAMEELAQLLTVRRTLSASLATFRQQLRALPHIQAVLTPVISALAQQLKTIDRQLAERASQEPAVKRLQAVHGIGLLSATALALKLRTIPFASYDAFVAYLGLDLRVSDSGEHRSRRRLSRQGDAELRRLLYCCAQSSIRAKGSPFRMQYERELAKGLPTTAAICAVARKMARLSWSLVRSGQKYDPTRVYQQRRVDKKP